MIRFTSIPSMHACARQGTGVMITPSAAVRHDLEQGRLVRLDWVETDRETTVTMIWHAEKWCSPILKTFMTLSGKMIREMG